MIYLDFETRSKADLRKIGAFLYAQHPSTEVMCCAYSFDDDPRVWLWHPGFKDQTPLMAKTKKDQAESPRELRAMPMPQNLFDRIASGETVEAHNSFFERCIYWFQCVQKFGWPKVKFPQWRCSASVAASYGLPRDLANLTGANGLNLAKHQKDMEGHRIMLKLCKPRVATKNGPQPEWHQNREDLIILFRYCVGDVRAERAASGHMRPLPPDELRAWQLNQRMNERGIHIDRDLCENALLHVDEYREMADKRIEELTGGAITKHTQKARLKTWMHSCGLMVDGVGAPVLKGLLEGGDLSEGNAELVDLWIWANKTSVAKYTTALMNMGDDDIVRDTSMYHGAHTGRDTGKKVQFLNMPRDCPKDIEDLSSTIIAHGDLSRWGNPIHSCSRALRGMVTARPGHDLMAADYAAIEARGTFWISDHEEGLENFRKLDAGELPGQDIYTLQASAMYGRLITKADDEERQAGKVAVLGCGYQMGGPKLVDYAMSNWGIELTEEEAGDIVMKYRSANKPVKDFWYACENSAIQAVRHKGKEIVQGKIKWRVHGNFLYCRLPSGRCQSYYRPSLKMVWVNPRKTKKNPNPEPFEKLSLRYWAEYKPKQYGHVSTYGGKLTENIVQAMCRDVMRDGMFRVDEAGYPMVFSVYDEVVSEPKKGFGSLEEFCDLLTTVPEWAPGFPIQADGWRKDRYRK